MKTLLILKVFLFLSKCENSSIEENKNAQSTNIDTKPETEKSVVLNTRCLDSGFSASAKAHVNEIKPAIDTIQVIQDELADIQPAEQSESLIIKDEIKTENIESSIVKDDELQQIENIVANNCSSEMDLDLDEFSNISASQNDSFEIITDDQVCEEESFTNDNSTHSEQIVIVNHEIPMCMNLPVESTINDESYEKEFSYETKHIFDFTESSDASISKDQSLSTSSENEKSSVEDFNAYPNSYINFSKKDVFNYQMRKIKYLLACTPFKTINISSCNLELSTYYDIYFKTDDAEPEFVEISIIRKLPISAISNTISLEIVLKNDVNTVPAVYGTFIAPILPTTCKKNSSGSMVIECVDNGIAPNISIRISRLDKINTVKYGKNSITCTSNVLLRPVVACADFCSHVPEDYNIKNPENSILDIFNRLKHGLKPKKISHSSLTKMAISEVIKSFVKQLKKGSNERSISLIGSKNSYSYILLEQYLILTQQQSNPKNLNSLENVNIESLLGELAKMMSEFY